MKTTTVTIRALHVDAGPAIPLAVERPQYTPVGDGHFEPANDAAYREVERWNAYADVWNARTATRSAP